MKKDRITPPNILKLKRNEIFVFGSNESGVHGAGAANIAYKKWNAIWGQAEGIQGTTYAIPTKNKAIKTLSIEEIKIYVDRFIFFAKITNPNLIFLVTEIGCGLAGLNVKDIGPLFKDAIEVNNIHLPHRFWLHINN